MMGMTTRNGSRRKVYVQGPHGVRVPFTEVVLTAPDEPPVRLYDTSGPGSDPAVGLPALRAGWIRARDDVEVYEGRRAGLRDDGRAAVRRGRAAEDFSGEWRPPLRARPGRT